MSEVVIIDGVRTPIGKIGGVLSSVRPDDLLAETYKALIMRTGINAEEITEVICTEVRFQKNNDEILEWYVNSGEPFGKAGAYSIQGLGAILVESISGSYNNVVGFPIERIIPHLTANAWISFVEKEKMKVTT